MSDTTGY